MFLFINLLLLGFMAQTDFSKSLAEQNLKAAWKQHDQILKQIKPPTFPNKNFLITDYGAVSDGKTDARPAILKAIDVCHKAGGGKVIIPAGVFVSNGAIHLKSNVNLHLEGDALLQFSTNHLDYTPLVLTRWEGTLCYNYSPLIYAYQQKNIAVTGKGVIDGNGDSTWKHWNNVSANSYDWSKSLQKQECVILRKMGAEGVPLNKRIFGHGTLDLDKDGKNDGDGKEYHLRPQLFQPFECQNILVEGVTFRNSPFWTLNPVFCENLTIRNITVLKGTTNDDGIDPDGCKNVLIENCYVDTHDDAISIKAGRDQDAWGKPLCENIIIRNCVLKTTCNAFCIGSEMSAGVKNVFFYNSLITKTDGGFNFKCNLDRGGQVEKVYIKNINIIECGRFFEFTMKYHSYRGGNFPTKFNDFYIENVTANQVSKIAFSIVGADTEPVRNVYLNQVTVAQCSGETKKIENASGIILHQVKVNQENISH